MKTTRAQLSIEILCQCPNCNYDLDLFDEHRVRESLEDDHRASNCNIEIECENCNETFLLTDVDF